MKQEEKPERGPRPPKARSHLEPEGQGSSAPAAESSGPPAPASSPVPATITPPPAERLPLLPLRSDVVFPDIVVPLVVGRERGIRLVDDVMEASKKRVALATQRSGEIEEPKQADLHPALCVAQILKMLKFPDGTTRIVVHGEARGRLADVVETEPFLVGMVQLFEDVSEQGIETDALTHN